MVIAVLTIMITFDQKLLIMAEGENKTQRTFTKKRKKRCYEKYQPFPFLVAFSLIYE